MKEQSAQLNYLRMAPRKVRLVADLIRGLSVNEAEALLSLHPRRAAEPLIKLLRSAIANAKNNQELRPESLLIKEIRVDDGPTLKRSMPRAMGRATPIHKKTSHITLVLAERDALTESRFKIVRRERIAKTAKIQKISKDKSKEPKPRVDETAIHKDSKKPGFIKRMFRRKSI